MRVVVRDQALDAGGRTVSETRVEQLLDAEHSLVRETVTDPVSGEVLLERSIVGNEVTSFYHGVDYVGYSMGLEPPASQLTLWGGYEDLLATGNPVELSDTERGHRLTIEIEAGGVVVFLRDDDLPSSIETTPSEGPGEMATARRITYETIEKIDSISEADVGLVSLPTAPLVVEKHAVLPTSDPRIHDDVPFSQYCLDTGVLGHELVHAEYLQFSPRADYAPAGIHGLVLIYNAPGGDRDMDDDDIQLTCHPVTGDHAEMILADYKAQIGDGGHQLWQRTVAGQKADVLVEICPLDVSRMRYAYVSLSDCVLELHSHISLTDLELVLESIRPLE